MKTILTIHAFSDENEFINQTLVWAEFPSPGAFYHCIHLLSFAMHPDKFRGSEQFPTESEGYKEIKRTLEMAREGIERVWNLGKGVDAPFVGSFRVVHFTDGWPFEVPNVLEH